MPHSALAVPPPPPPALAAGVPCRFLQEAAGNPLLPIGTTGLSALAARLQVTARPVAAFPPAARSREEPLAARVWGRFPGGRAGAAAERAHVAAPERSWPLFFPAAAAAAPPRARPAPRRRPSRASRPAAPERGGKGKAAELGPASGSRGQGEAGGGASPRRCVPSPEPPDSEPPSLRGRGRRLSVTGNSRAG